MELDRALWVSASDLPELMPEFIEFSSCMSTIDSMNRSRCMIDELHDDAFRRPCTFQSADRCDPRRVKTEMLKSNAFEKPTPTFAPSLRIVAIVAQLPSLSAKLFNQRDKFWVKRSSVKPSSLGEELDCSVFEVDIIVKMEPGFCESTPLMDSDFKGHSQHVDKIGVVSASLMQLTYFRSNLFDLFLGYFWSYFSGEWCDPQFCGGVVITKLSTDGFVHYYPKAFEFAQHRVEIDFWVLLFTPINVEEAVISGQVSGAFNRFDIEELFESRPVTRHSVIGICIAGVAPPEERRHPSVPRILFAGSGLGEFLGLILGQHHLGITGSRFVAGVQFCRDALSLTMLGIYPTQPPVVTAFLFVEMSHAILLLVVAGVLAIVNARFYGNLWLGPSKQLKYGCLWLKKANKML
jgi:hypothetical protein